MAFNYSTPHFGQTSSSSSAPFAAPSESSSVFAQITPSPFGRSNSSSFGGFQTANTSPFGSGFFGSTNSGFGVSNAPNSGFNFNSSTTPMFGVPNPFSAFGVQSSSSGGLSSSCFKTGDNQAKVFQSIWNSPFQAPTTPSLWSTPAFGVQRPAGGDTPFCFNTPTTNSPFDNLFRNQSTAKSPFDNLFRNQSTANSPFDNLFRNQSTANSQTFQSANPFGVQYEIDGPKAIITIQNGTSTIQVSGEVSSLTIRQVPSKQDKLPARGNNGGSSEPCFANSHGIVQRTTISEVNPPNARPSNQYRATPGKDANNEQINSISAMPIFENKSHEELRLEDYVLRGGKGCEGGKASFKLNLNEIEVSEEEDDAEANKKREADILALMPKLPDGDYYTEPSIKDLAAKEISEPGFCSRVNDFVVGRKGYGSIKFLGETDIRNLDIESVIHFNNREVIVYPDSTKKPPAGQSLNKPAEVTLMNVKCINKKTGKEFVDGVEVQRYKEILIKKASEHGVEFVSYDPVQGVWKFRVQHF
ncbi:hypothetical protein ABFS82_02G084000 [Erythranthe guttata]|nr:PREDICTED: nuclear pore complex protein NUP98A-like [Erythranthe guttata]|eukprot:XP_012859045.1 PREDICTED: nuclear pore complex protein NUP98A-like [Erythranthe guttata]